jgi:hypothetical protein
VRRLWLALWLAVVGWDALFPHIMTPAPRLAILTLLLAGALLFSVRPRTGVWFTPGLSAALSAAAAVCAAMLPWPERLGFILVAAGSLTAALPSRGSSIGGRVWRSASGLGALLVLFAGASHLYAVLESSAYRLGFLVGPMAFLYRALGVPAVADAPFVHIQGVGGVTTVDTAVGRVIGQPLALFVVAGLAVWMVVRGRGPSWRRPTLFLVCAAGFALVRFLVLGLALNDVSGPSLYWLRGWGFGGLLSLVALLAWAVPFRGHRGLAGSGDPPGAVGLRSITRGRGALALASAIALGVLAAASMGFSDPGVRKPGGRVIVDERHSNWAWSTVQLNTESYGTQTVYNYSEMLRFLGHFYEIAPSFAAITDSLLDGTDVLVLKAPTRPYEDREVEAVVRFVERGGGVWLIGDHTNIFGMSTNLNSIARRFGLGYRYDAVIDLTTGGRQLFERPRVFCHPSIAHLPPLLLATSCSLEGPPLGRRVMVGRSLLSDELDYSVNTFFGNFKPDPFEPFGSMLQSMSFTRGKGRVLAFTDSTIFSNFFIFIRGKRELALGSVAWLMRESRWTWAHPAFLAGAMAALFLWLWAAARIPRASALGTLGLGGFPAFALVALGLSLWVSGWSVLPQPKVPLLEAAFMREHCAFHVPEKTNLPDKSPHSYHTFYIWTQRVGYFPRTDPLFDCLANSDVTVIVNPRGEFTEDALGRLEDYVRRGGGLLVIDRPYIKESTANEVLGRFGMRFADAQEDSVDARDVATGKSITLKRVGVVDGGDPLVVLPDGRSVASIARVGDGHVVAVSGADNFSDEALGTTSQTPDENQLKLYRLEFRIFGELLRRAEPEGAPGAQQSAVPAGSP